MDNNKLKEILQWSTEVVMSRGGDVDTEDGSFATVDIDNLIRLEMAISDGFSLDSDNISTEELYKIDRQIDDL